MDYLFETISFRLAWPIATQSRDKQTRRGNLLVLLNGLLGLFHSPCSRDPVCAWAAEFSSGDPTRHTHFNLLQLVGKMVIISLPRKNCWRKSSWPARYWGMKGNTVSGTDYCVWGASTYSIFDNSFSLDGTGEQTPEMSSEQQVIRWIVLSSPCLCRLRGSPFRISIHFNFPLRGDIRQGS